MDALKVIAQDSLKTGDEIPQIKIGDTVKVSVKIREGERERIQAFEGTVIARKGSGVSETFTVRRVSYGLGVDDGIHIRLHDANAKAHGLKFID